MADTVTPNFNITKPEAGKNNWHTDYAALCDLIDSRLAIRFRNFIINGGFDIWQRGTNFNVGNNVGGYTVDRFQLWDNGGVGSAGVISRNAFTPGQTDVPGSSKYSFNLNVTTATAGFWRIFHKIEDVSRLAGETVTFSFWAKSDVPIAIAPHFSQVFTSVGGQNTDVILGVSANVTTSWQKFTATINTASLAGKTFNPITDYTSIELYFPGATTFSCDIANLQLELGSFATDFEYRDPATELFLCKRYYREIKQFMGLAGSGTLLDLYIQLEIPMRTTPTLGQTGTIAVDDRITNFTQSAPSISFIARQSEVGGIVRMSNYTGLSTGVTYVPAASAGNITLSAEL